MKSQVKKNNSKIKAVGFVLAGGESKRLFPWKYSKTLLEVNGESLLKQALDRLAGLDQSFVVTNAAISKEITQHFKSKKLKAPDYILEPEPRDTAAAIGFALTQLKSKPEWVVVLSGDQYIPDTKKYREFLKNVEKEVKKFPQALFVAGSLPSTKTPASHSQFGWILPKKSNSKSDLSYAVETFVEKPKGAKLTNLRRKKGLINAGMFFGRYETFIEAYKKFYPAVMEKNPNYSRLEKKPVDRAIFENYSEVRALPFSIKWEDLGTWDSIHSKVGGQASHQIKSKNVFTWSNSEREIYVFNMKDIAVVEAGNKTLVMPISETPRLKEYLQQLDKKNPK